MHLEESPVEAVKLFKLIASMAISNASVERSFSCLNRVMIHLRGKRGQERLSSLYRGSIRKDLEDSYSLHLFNILKGMSIAIRDFTAKTLTMILFCY